MTSALPPTVGRFAPSPTGELHFGSLLSAVASFLDARSRGGSWLLRIEDIDIPRTVPGSVTAIMNSLNAHGLTWDGDPVFQSQRTHLYRAALEQMAGDGALFGCQCSRRQIAGIARRGDHGYIYPGTCRDRGIAAAGQVAVRVRTDYRPVCFEDTIQSEQCQTLAEEVGDFVVRRADGIFAYQLAVVVDDAAQGVTRIVRGTDILPSTPRQIHLQRLLGLPCPVYLHHPLAVTRAGIKLSKQSRAPALDPAAAASNLFRVLRLLGQRTHPALDRQPVWSIIEWALAHWSPGDIPARLTVVAEGGETGHTGAGLTVQGKTTGNDC